MTLTEFHRLRQSTRAIVLPADSAAAMRPLRPSAIAYMAVRRDLTFKYPKAAGAFVALRKTAKK
jgi:hypothetical protein